MIPQSDLLRLFTGTGIPFFLDENGRPCLWFDRGASETNAVICSIPKSGTYLYAELLKALGLHHCAVHLREDGFTDYRFATLHESRTQHRSLAVTMDLAESLALLRPGQFAVGHLPHTEKTRDQLAKLKVVFTYRDLRDAMVSQMRFFAAAQRGSAVSDGWGALPDGPEKMKRYIQHHGEFFMVTRCQTMVPWLDEPNVFKASFEVIQGDFGPEKRNALVQELAAFLGLECPELNDEFFGGLLGRKTMTASGTRTDRSVFWDEEVDAFFSQHGGHEMNRKLGFAV